MRTLYQHSARRSAITQKYVAAVTARGAEVRTLDEFFNRMIVVDRRVAVIPAADTLSTAVVVREPAVVGYLIDVFERAWARGPPVCDVEEKAVRRSRPSNASMTIRMLIAGHADAVSAKRLGVSPRTYAGYVADLKIEYDAETRFQLGYTMGSAGISGNEAAESRRAGGEFEESGNVNAPPDWDAWRSASVNQARAGPWRPTLQAPGSPSLVHRIAGRGCDRDEAHRDRGGAMTRLTRRANSFIFSPNRRVATVQIHLRCLPKCPDEDNAATRRLTCRSDCCRGVLLETFPHAITRWAQKRDPRELLAGASTAAEAEGFEPSMGL